MKFYQERVSNSGGIRFLSRVSMQCMQSAILLRQIRLSVRLSLRLPNAGTVTNEYDVTLLDGLVVNLVIFFV